MTPALSARKAMAMKSAERIRNLMVMALADGNLTEREVRYLTERCRQLGLGDSELRSAVDFALQAGAEVKLTSDPAEADSVLGDLLRMMAADGALADDEKQLFAVCAVKLGFDGEDIDSLIDRLIEK